jgi:hypothetical protein
MPHCRDRIEVNCFCEEHLTSGARKFATIKSQVQKEGSAAGQGAVLAGNMVALFGHLMGCQFIGFFSIERFRQGS